MSKFWDYLNWKRDKKKSWDQIRGAFGQSAGPDHRARGSRIHLPPVKCGEFTTTLGVRPGTESFDDILEYPTEGYIEIPNIEDDGDEGYAYLFRVNVSAEKMTRTFKTLSRVMPDQAYGIIELPMDLEHDDEPDETGLLHELETRIPGSTACENCGGDCGGDINDDEYDDEFNIPYLSDFVSVNRILEVFDRYKFQILNDGMIGFGMAHYDEIGRHTEVFLNCEKFFQVYTCDPEPVRMLLAELMIPRSIETRFITETAHVHYSLHYLSREDPKLRYLGAPHYNYEVFGPHIIRALKMRKSWED